jgi:GTP cyclohydrolase I
MDTSRGAYPTEAAASAYEALVGLAGDSVTRDGLRDTPMRAARAWADLTAGYREPPPDLKTFDADHDEVVVVSPIPFYSLCEHHLLPFHGQAHVAYIPAGRIVGLSKFARVVYHFARRLQVQERLTTQVADYIEEGLNGGTNTAPVGLAVVIQAEHLCMSMRGAQVPGAITTTSVMRGAFRDKGAARSEVLGLMGVG